MNSLCIDIGNTNTKYALFKDGILAHKEMYEGTMDATHADNLLRKFKVDNAILSATKSYTEDLSMVLERLDYFVTLSHRVSLPFKNNYTTPETLGRDRIALVAAVQSLQPHKNVLAIDVGSCITIDAINNKGEYFGGSIHPGLKMRLKAMHKFTGKLPDIPLEPFYNLWGTSSKEAILAGSISATIAEINAIIGEYHQYYDNLIVYLTGGDAEYFVNQLKYQIFVDPDLVLLGLYQILIYNAK
jgi:type III pantothenate kinase